MISMTGYTRREFKINDIKFILVIKSLNSTKGLDLSIKTPRYLLELEPDIKKILDKKLIRGKVEFKLSEFNENRYLDLDEKKISHYINGLKKISPDSDQGQILSAAISLPDIFRSSSSRFTKKMKQQILNNINISISNLIDYREKEGLKLIAEIKKYIKNILKNTQRLVSLEKKRQSRKKNKLIAQLKNVKNNIEYDNTRLESEMIYYFEKFDITEERIRLDCHCEFFQDIIKNEPFSGRKLIFLSQEILREINTIGSKANDFEIQKRVVEMKESIDKIKEQLQNIL